MPTVLPRFLSLAYQQLQANPTAAACRALNNSETSKLPREAAPLAQVPVRLWKPDPLRQVLR